MKLAYKNGITSVILRVKIIDSTTGNGKTNLDHTASGLIVSTIADNEATATVYTSTNLETITTLGTFAAPTSGKARFKKVDDTNHPGVYEIHIADARWAVSGARSVIVSVLGVADTLQYDTEIQLEPVPADALRIEGSDATDELEDAVTTVLGTSLVDILDRLPTTLSGGKMRAQIEGADANTINAFALAADAVAEIQSGLATSAEVGAVETDTQDIQNRLPAALVNNRMDSTIDGTGMESGAVAAIFAFVLGGTRTVAQSLRGFSAILLGKASGLDTGSPVYRDPEDTKDVAAATTDMDGNRSAVTLDLDP